MHPPYYLRMDFMLSSWIACKIIARMGKRKRIRPRKIAKPIFLDLSFHLRCSVEVLWIRPCTGHPNFLPRMEEHIRMLRPRSLLKSSSKLTILLAFGASSESSATLVCKKKLYACRPKSVPQQIETQRTRRKQRTEPCDPASLERAVRQLLADKISGNQVGIWLLAPEHLRLGTWYLLCAWSQSGGQTIWPRMALHLVHEAAFCVNGL